MMTALRRLDVEDRNSLWSPRAWRYSLEENQEAQVLAAAHALADRDGGIAPVDRRDIAFCHIDDVEFVLQVGNADSFLAACRAISSGDRKGWMLSAAHITPPNQDRPYPFVDRIAELLPWMAAARRR